MQHSTKLQNPTNGKNVFSDIKLEDASWVTLMLKLGLDPTNTQIMREIVKRIDNGQTMTPDEQVMIGKNIITHHPNFAMHTISAMHTTSDRIIFVMCDISGSMHRSNLPEVLQCVKSAYAGCNILFIMFNHTASLGPFTTTPDCSGGTNGVPALQILNSELLKLKPNDRVSLIVITDGQWADYKAAYSKKTFDSRIGNIMLIFTTNTPSSAIDVHVQGLPHIFNPSIDVCVFIMHKMVNIPPYCSIEILKKIVNSLTPDQYISQLDCERCESENIATIPIPSTLVNAVNYRDKLMGVLNNVNTQSGSSNILFRYVRGVMVLYCIKSAQDLMQVFNNLMKSADAESIQQYIANILTILNKFCVQCKSTGTKHTLRDQNFKIFWTFIPMLRARFETYLRAVEVENLHIGERSDIHKLHNEIGKTLFYAFEQLGRIQKEISALYNFECQKNPGDVELRSLMLDVRGKNETDQLKIKMHNALRNKAPGTHVVSVLFGGDNVQKEDKVDLKNIPNCDLKALEELLKGIKIVAKGTPGAIQVPVSNEGLLLLVQLIGSSSSDDSTENVTFSQIIAVRFMLWLKAKFLENSKSSRNGIIQAILRHAIAIATPFMRDLTNCDSPESPNRSPPWVAILYQLAKCGVVLPMKDGDSTMDVCWDADDSNWVLSVHKLEGYMLVNEAIRLTKCIQQMDQRKQQVSFNEPYKPELTTSYCCRIQGHVKDLDPLIGKWRGGGKLSIAEILLINSFIKSKLPDMVPGQSNLDETIHGYLGARLYRVQLEEIITFVVENPNHRYSVILFGEIKDVHPVERLPDELRVQVLKYWDAYEGPKSNEVNPQFETEENAQRFVNWLNDQHFKRSCKTLVTKDHYIKYICSLIEEYEVRNCILQEHQGNLIRYLHQLKNFPFANNQEMIALCCDESPHPFNDNLMYQSPAEVQKHVYSMFEEFFRLEDFTFDDVDQEEEVHDRVQEKEVLDERFSALLTEPEEPEYNLKDPITFDLYEDPVYLGLHIYSRGSITRWIQERGTNPMTRESCTVSDLVPVTNPVFLKLLKRYTGNESDDYKSSSAGGGSSSAGGGSRSAGGGSRSAGV